MTHAKYSLGSAPTAAMNPVRDVHVVVAIACYLACFFAPAIYTGDRFEPMSPIAMLMIGWAAALELNFTWFANIFFVAAVFRARSRPGTSAALAGMALILALSFLLYGHVRAHEIASKSPITAYGWGYALWVTSMTVLATGQLARLYGGRYGARTLAALLSGGLVIVGYGTYLASGAGGLYANSKERDRVFEASCKTTGTRVLRRVTNARSVYLEPDSAWTVAPRSSWTPERKYRASRESMRNNFLRSGRLDFVETNAREGSKGHLRFTPGDTAGTPVELPQAMYAVSAQEHDLPHRLGLVGETVLIKDRRNGTLLARASYVLDRETGRYCGPPGITFSTRAFVADVLGL